MKQFKDVTDPQLAKAMIHPLRLRILTVLGEREASPSEIAEDLGAPLGNVSYHVRILVSLGLVELVRTVPRRGSVAHYYSATVRPQFGEEILQNISPAIRNTLYGMAVEKAGKDLSVALREDAFNRAEAHCSRTPVNVDAEGWNQLAQASQEFLDRVDHIEHEATGRMKKEGTAREPALTLLMIFDNKTASGKGAAAAEPTEADEVESGAEGDKTSGKNARSKR